MSLKKTTVAVMAVALFGAMTAGHAQTSRTNVQPTYTIPGTNLRVNHAPYRIYRFGGTTVYQFNRRQTGFTWPNAYPGTYTYGPYYSYPYSYPVSQYFGYP